MAVTQSSFATQMTAQIAAVNAAIATIGTLENNPPTILATIYTAVQSARVPFDNAIAAFDADIDGTSVGGVVPGIPAPQLATALLNQASDLMQEWLVIIAEAYLVRVGVNAVNPPGGYNRTLTHAIPRRPPLQAVGANPRHV